MSKTLIVFFRLIFIGLIILSIVGRAYGSPDTSEDDENLNEDFLFFLTQWDMPLVNNSKTPDHTDNFFDVLLDKTESETPLMDKGRTTSEGKTDEQ